MPNYSDLRNFHRPGRSVVYAMNGMVATSHPLATGAAIRCLQDGGNAVDAAITACAVQGVVEPQSTGIGGDCFALLAPKGGPDFVAFYGSGRAPAHISLDKIKGNNDRTIPRQSAHAVTIPGAVDAWCRLVEDYGTKSLGELLAPAINYAERGYPIFERVAYDWRDQVGKLRSTPSARAIFLPSGDAPSVGSTHSQPQLAAALRAIAEHGRTGFYDGWVAEDMVDYLREHGGSHRLDDFTSAQGEYVTPIQTKYKELTVHECPPNGQGFAALEMLNILQGFDSSNQDPLSVERFHLQIEATRLAYSDRDSLLTDPRFGAVPLNTLLSEDYARSQREKIRLNSAMTLQERSHTPAHPDTVCLSVVDRDRNVVSFINSIFDSFGSGLVTPRAGILLHNRGAGFVLEENHPNCIEAGKRPLHTIIPGLVTRDGRVTLSFGVMGGEYQAVGHAHLLSNLCEFHMDLQAAIDAPRVFAPSVGPVQVETEIPSATIAGLNDLGHKTAIQAKPIGGAQAVAIDWETGVLAGASDPRKDGCALGY
ncbi:MAG: gamma-glutamyltransferase [Rhodospirillaceae bacterium]